MNDQPDRRVDESHDLFVAEALSGEVCSTAADDGQQCQRIVHSHDPDAHVFAAQGSPADSVDGGRKWSDWIDRVHAVRRLLLAQVGDDGKTRYGALSDWSLEVKDGLLAEIALAVDLHLHEINGRLLIVENDQGEGQ
jgi:hypothetical protein